MVLIIVWKICWGIEMIDVVWVIKGILVMQMDVEE